MCKQTTGVTSKRPLLGHSSNPTQVKIHRWLAAPWASRRPLVARILLFRAFPSGDCTEEPSCPRFTHVGIAWVFLLPCCPFCRTPRTVIARAGLVSTSFKRLPAVTICSMPFLDKLTPPILHFGRHNRLQHCLPLGRCDTRVFWILCPSVRDVRRSKSCTSLRSNTVQNRLTCISPHHVAPPLGTGSCLFCRVASFHKHHMHSTPLPRAG